VRKSVHVLLEGTNVKQENRMKETMKVSKTTPASALGRIRLALRVLCVAVILMVSLLGRTVSAQTFGCSPAMANDIVCENSKTGSQPSSWEVSGSGDSTLQGFC